jgi:hypothetical protein
LNGRRTNTTRHETPERPANKELDRAAPSRRPVRLVLGAAGQFQRSRDLNPARLASEQQNLPVPAFAPGTPEHEGAWHLLKERLVVAARMHLNKSARSAPDSDTLRTDIGTVPASPEGIRVNGRRINGRRAGQEEGPANKQMQPTKRDGGFCCPAPRASLAQPRFAADLQRSTDQHEDHH